LDFERAYVQDIRHAVGALRKEAGQPMMPPVATPTPTPPPVVPPVQPGQSVQQVIPPPIRPAGPGFPLPTPSPAPGPSQMTPDDLMEQHGLNPLTMQQAPGRMVMAEENDPVVAEIKKKAELAKKGFITETLDTLGHGLDSFLSGHADTTLKNHFGTSVGDNTAQGKVNNTLDNMERKLILQELLLTDPILSKINPAKVARAYEQLLRLAPQLSKEKEIVRAELRGMVASQALSKYDADLMTKLDTDMMKNRIGSQAFMSGKTDTFKI